MAAELNESLKDFAKAMKPPPLLVSFQDAEQYLNALSQDIRLDWGEQIRRLCESCFPPIVSVRSLATLFGYSPRFVGAMRKSPERYYRTFTIPKRRAKRVIHAPKVALKVIQKWFGFHLSHALHFDDSIYGFVPGRSAVGAARKHCQARWVYSVDIEDFFPSVSRQTVTDALIRIGYPPHGAELAADLCCFNGGLAQGSPASPVLSNLAFRDADSKLVDIAGSLEIRYTRYADDIVFSGLSDFPHELKTAVRSVIEQSGWKLSPPKVYLAEKPRRLKVHGLLVDGSRPRLTKGYRNKIRAYQHLVETNSVRSEDLRRVLGHLAYADSVDVED